MKHSGFGVAAAFALAAAALAGGPAVSSPTVSVNRLRRLIRDSAGRPVHYASYSKKTGWTNASYRRAAVKKRNQARHRRACRG